MSSQKITSKNLSYDTSLPPFLAALKAQAGGASGPDPLLAANRSRGVKKRSGSEEAEDAPLVVDEHGNVVGSVQVDKDGAVTTTTQDGKDDDSKTTSLEQKKDEQTKGDKDAAAKASIGGRKRKVGRVVGGDAADEKEDDEPAKSKKDGGDKEKEAEPAKDRKPKKKAKKIKLSFDEDTG